MKRIILICGLLSLFAGSFIIARAASPAFFYVATTVDANGLESAFSNQVTASLAQGQHNVNLSWTIPTVPTGGAAIAGFNVYRATTTGGPYTKVNTTLLAATATTYTDSFVLPNAPTLAAPTTN